MSQVVIRAFGGLALLVPALSAVGQDSEADGSRVFFCARLESGNLRSDETECTGFSFSDGINTITAGRAAYRGNGENAIGTLNEGVSFAFESTEVVADSASFAIENGVLALAELSGNPVRLSDHDDESNSSITGTAEKIVYDRPGGTLRLLRRATIHRGGTGFESCDLIYNLNDQGYQGGGTDECGVRVIYVPPEDEEIPEGQTESP